MNNEFREITSFDGTVLKCLIRESGNSKWLIVSHGLGEHSGRHEYLLKFFSQNFNIAIYDLRGHGRSAGPRAYVESFQDFSRDLQSVIDYLKKEFNMNDFVLYGHSMGGLITADYMQNFAQKDFLPSKVFLSSPAVGAPGLMGPIFSNAPILLFEALKKLPSIPLARVLDLKKLSHDRRVYEDYIKDELNVLKVHTHLFFELLRTAREVFSRPLRIDCPLFVAVGTDDALVNSGLVKSFFTEVEKNAQFREFSGGYHELHNEVEKFRKPYLNFLRESLTGLTFE